MQKSDQKGSSQVESYLNIFSLFFSNRKLKNGGIVC